MGKVQIPLSGLVGADKTREIITLDPRTPSQAWTNQFICQSINSKKFIFTSNT
jgi:hypothetical protein